MLGMMDMHALTRFLRARRAGIGLLVDLLLLAIGWTGFAVTLVLLVVALLVDQPA